ncbi:Transcription factor bHLH140 [Rhynchospora pubera]|uniref:Transcription factor bHLH140 n=1 Tax=Rhynchospora pubera TaxID=906938 RepID=A0AAV8D6V2_9POAL|nr:Transcription factor bHLH140 [Rhynchospora pubera]
MDGGASSDSRISPKGKEEESNRTVLAILVGPPGSGKSTFCEAVISASRRPWVRVCQDTIGNGKTGTKAQCLKGAVDALNEGKSVFIDRCNLEREQRADFLKFCGSRTDMHAIVLDLPAKVCISRCVNRTGHEGNVQGGRAAVIVNKMLQNKEAPNLNEGFSRITFCQNDSDVKEAIKMYSELGPADKLSPGEFGKKSKKESGQQSIMKFFKKSAREENSQKEKEGGSSSGNGAGNEFPTLAFPSISTADFQFDLDKASDIIVESAQDFLKRVDNVRLALVDLSDKSRIISLVREKVMKKGIDSNRFITFVGDITMLYSKGGLRCTAIANAANWRLKPGGGGVNAAIFKAAGEALDIATKERAETLNPGSSVAVPLPSTSPLYQREGVTHVIHVLGPNMNPQRPNYLQNDYTKGCKILRDAYSSLFESFASVACLERNKKPKLAELKDKTSGESKNKENREEVKSRNQNQTTTTTTTTSGESKNKENREEVKSRNWGSWALALYNTAMDPEKYKDGLLEIADDFIVLNDLYPKARKHVLVLSRLNGLDCLEDAKREHLPILKSMHSAGVKWVKKFLSEDPSPHFRLGYHSVPSMRQLHLHVISQDFDSPSLKNKKHWNSFNTAFFRDSVDVIDEIEEHGSAKLSGEKLLEMELRCHRCKSAHPNIPKLKSHIAKCRASYPPHLLQNSRLLSATNNDLNIS